MTRSPSLETIESPRLVFRRPALSDVPAIFTRFASDLAVARYVAWPCHQSEEDSRQFLGFSNSEWEQAGVGPYLMCEKESGTLVGSTGLSMETSYRASTGYVLARDAWGKGYATEAARTMVDLGRKLALSRLHAWCHVDHHASARVLEKAGFLKEGVLRRYLMFPNLGDLEPSDVLLYAFAFPANAGDA